jgi:hypothetical protein
MQPEATSSSRSSGLTTVPAPISVLAKGCTVSTTSSAPIAPAVKIARASEFSSR